MLSVLLRISGPAGWLLCGVALGQWSLDARKCAESFGSDEAIAACNRAIMSRDLSSLHLTITLYNRGTAWNSKGDHDRAIEDFSEAIRLRPEYASAYNNRGNAWGKKGEYANRTTAYEPYMDAPRLAKQSLFALAGQVKIAAIYPAFG